MSQGWHGDREGHSKAGKKGGLKTAKTHGPEFYKKIGKMGGRTKRSK